MSPVRVSVTEADVPELELALGYALSIWTNALMAGRSPEWERYAMTGHAIRNTLSWMGPVDGQRIVFWSEDASETLHAVARQVENGPQSFALLGRTVRRYADLAADADSTCRANGCDGPQDTDSG